MTTAPQDHLPARRPAKQAQRAQQRKQAAMDAEAIGVRIDGVDYVINPNDLTGRVEMEIRREIGMGLLELQQKLEASPGIDYLGMFMWAIRHANGEQVDLMDVLDSVSAGSQIDVLEEPPAAPKA